MANQKKNKTNSKAIIKLKQYNKHLTWQLRKAFNIVAVLLSLPQNTENPPHNHLRTEDTFTRIKLIRHISTITYYYAVIN